MKNVLCLFALAISATATPVLSDITCSEAGQPCPGVTETVVADGPSAALLFADDGRGADAPFVLLSFTVPEDSSVAPELVTPYFLGRYISSISLAEVPAGDGRLLVDQFLFLSSHRSALPGFFGDADTVASAEPPAGWLVLLLLPFLLRIKFARS